MSKNNKPTIPELNNCLSSLVKWQQFALYLPGIDHTDISIIEKDKRDDVAEQKRILYDKWLQVYPNASWNDVIKALETAKENAIAKQLRENFILTEPEKKTSSSGQSQPEEVTVSEDIVSELDTLQRSFVGLTGDVKMGVERQLENGIENNIKSLTRDLQEERAFPIPSLDSVTTSDELFKAIHPHYNFLNCYLIVSIALHLSGTIAEKATEYKENIFRFMKTTKLRFLQNTLKRYSKMLRTHSNTTIVEIVVENGWGDQNIWLVKMLIKFLFPVRHPDELPWYDIVPGSVVMTFIALEHMTPSLIESSRKKTEFMRLIGVIKLKIGNKVVWKNRSKIDQGDKKPFFFENSLIQATLADNFEATLFVLQYTQVNINTKNTTNALINADKELYYSQQNVERFLAMYHTTFTALLKDVEYEFQNVQGRMTVVDNINASDNSFSVSDNDKFTHHPQDSFLNGRVLAGLSDQLPEHLSKRVKQYQATIDGIIKRGSLLIHLSSIEEYFPTPFPNSIEVILSLHSVWRACSVWYVEQLGQLIFTPTLFHKLQWFRVDTSKESLRVVLLADKELMDSLTKESLDNESRSPLLGVISVRVDDTVVISNDYSNGYTFNEAFELAKAMENDEISDLILQILQSPVDFIRFGKPDNNNNYRFLPEPDSTPLMIACCNDNSQLVQLLLGHNADPNIQSRNSYTALMYSTGNSKIFQMLLDHGADITVCSFLNDTVLYNACRAGNLKVTRIVLATDHNFVHIATNDGQTPLKVASKHGHTKIVALLLQANADPNIQDNSGWTALKSASHSGHTLVAEMLLQAKADPNIQDNEGWTALKSASRYGHTEIVQMLLQAKADLNIQSIEGWTALNVASRYGHTEIVEMLLLAKADPNIKSNKGWTALNTASHYGDTEVVRMLLQAKADPNIQDNEGWTALKSASHNGHTEIVILLLQAKADPNTQNNSGWTALQSASSVGHTQIVEILLQAKANPSLVNYNGQTALDLALEHGHNDISEQLCSVLFD